MSDVLTSLLSGFHKMDQELYRNTGYQPKAVGIALDDEMFWRAASSHVSRMQGGMPGETLEEILERGYFDGALNGSTGILFRIAKWSAING